MNDHIHTHNDSDTAHERQHHPEHDYKDTHDTKTEPEKNVLMAILAYIGPLVLISYSFAKDDPFVKFHIKQGLLLLIGEVATWMVAMMIWILFPLAQIINIFLFVLAIVGIIRSAKGEMKELPFIGHLAKSINF